jgi:uncharacterized protein YdeI (YjbR/CyaY-like superfamily)
LRAYIHESVEVEKAGLRVDFKQTTEFTMPEEFQRKMAEVPALKTYFPHISG